MDLFSCRISGRARIKKNGKRIMQNKSTGARWIGSSDEYKKWAIYASMFINNAKKNKIIDYPVNLSIICHYTNHAHEQDLDNVISSITDVLQDCDVIINDKLFYSFDGCRKIFDSDSDCIFIKINHLKPLE